MVTQRPRAGFFYIFMVIALLAVFILTMSRGNAPAVTTQREFFASVKDDKVASAVIKPNAQGTAGEVIANMKDGTESITPNCARVMLVSEFSSIWKSHTRNDAIVLSSITIDTVDMTMNKSANPPNTSDDIKNGLFFSIFYLPLL